LRIALVTSLHPALDKRIYHRQARFLARAGMDVHLVAPGAEPGITPEGIRLHGIPRHAGRLGRFHAHRAIDEAVERIAPDLVHFHDPDLLLHIRRGRYSGDPIIVYDAHEDFPLAARSSRGLPPVVAQVISLAVDATERFLARRVDGVVSAHRRRLAQLALGDRGLYLPNYPSLEAFPDPPAPVPRERHALYLGLLSPSRGAETLLAAARLAPDIRWRVVGDFQRASDREEFLARVREEEMGNLEWVGVVPYREVPSVLARAGVGLMPWRATPQHRWAAQPTKLYEYLAAALPIVASRLDITEEVVAGSGAGLLHPPDDPEALVASVRRILDDSRTAARFGRAGREAFLTRFNYERLGAELLVYYGRLGRLRAG
jgi:glycosyltransferase involved in cell wall biosynthesis